MSNTIPQAPPIEFKPARQGFKPGRKYVIIAALLIAVIAAVYFVFLRTGFEFAYDDATQLENIDGEALNRTLEGENGQHIYSANGKILSIEEGSLSFRIERTTEIDGEQFVDFIDKTGRITDETTVFRVSIDPNDPVLLVVEPATLSDIRVSDEVDIRSFRNLLLLEEFNINEIYIQP